MILTILLSVGLGINLYILFLSIKLSRATKLEVKYIKEKVAEWQDFMASLESKTKQIKEERRNYWRNGGDWIKGEEIKKPIQRNA